MSLFSRNNEPEDLLDIDHEIKTLSKAHPELHQGKFERRMPRLEKMTRFYEEKAPIAPGMQSKMFYDFVSALMYAMSVIKMYQRLTRKLARLSEEVDRKHKG